MKKFLQKIVLLLCLICSVLLFGACSAATEVDINTMQDVTDNPAIRIGVMLGSMQEKIAGDLWGADRLQLYNSHSEATQALEGNKVDIVLEAETFGQILCAENDRVKMIDEKISPTNVAMALKKGKGTSPLAMNLNSFIKKAREEGTLDRLKEKWMHPDAVSAGPVDNDGSAGTFVVGTSINGAPFMMQNGDGSFMGYDADILTAFANEYHYQIQWQVINFAGLIAALDTGKIDLICSALSVTEERQQKVDFTEPYFRGYVAGIVRSDVASVSPFSGMLDGIYKNFIDKDRYQLVLSGIGVTLVVAIISVLLGTLLGGGVCLLRMAKNPILNKLGLAYIEVLRGIPSLVVLMFTFYVFFGNVNVHPIYAAAIAFSLHFSAYAAEIFRTSILAVNPGQLEAARAMGLRPFKAFVHIVLPQAARIALPVYKGEFINLVKGTSIVGYVALVDLTKAVDIIRSQTFDAFVPLLVVAILYFCLSYLLTYALGRIEIHIDPQKKRRLKQRKAARKGGAST